ncbi:MAG: hypothetical protein JSR77_02095 [Planctomycetes bacterium]|nr:hypothetical protein [Planctomycetota bacterium]
MKTRLIMTTAMGVLGAATISAAAVTNGGFETGTFADWTYTGNTGSSAANGLLARDPLNAGTQAPLSGEWRPLDGNYFAALWSTDSLDSSTAQLTQTFEAPPAAALEFDVFFDFGDFAPAYDTAQATLRWATGAATLIAFNIDPMALLGDDVNVDWTHVSFPLPGPGSYTLEFTVTDFDGTFESVLGVDNVFVTPSPGAGLLLGLGVLGALGRRSRPTVTT